MTPVAVDCVGGGRDEAQYFFALLVITDDTNGGRVVAYTLAIWPSVLGQMLTPPVRQNQGYVCKTACFFVKSLI